MINKINNILKNQKNKEIAINIFLSFIIKGFSFLVSLFSMPLYVKYFNNEAVLGIWFTIISMLNWLLAFDLGLGNGLRNSLVGTLVNKDNEKSKELISNAYFFLGIISIFAFLLLNLIIHSFNINNLLNIDPSIISNETLRISVTILVFGIVLSFFLRLINSILYAMQKSSITNFITLLTSIIPLIYMFIIGPSTNISKNLINLSIVQVIANCLPLLIISFFVFSIKTMKLCRPNIKYINKDTCKSIFGLGGLFFIAQISFMLLNNSNEIIITKCYSPSYVVDYSIYHRLFTAFGTIFTLALAPLWSSVTKAINEKDYFWIKKIYKYLNYITILAIIVQFCSLPFLQFIIDIWMGKDMLIVNLFYGIVFASFGSIYIYNIVLTTLANGMGKLKPQIVIYTIGMVLKIPLILFFRDLGFSWIIVVLYNFFILLIFCITENYDIKKILKSFDKKKA